MRQKGKSWGGSRGKIENKILTTFNLLHLHNPETLYTFNLYVFMVYSFCSTIDTFRHKGLKCNHNCSCFSFHTKTLELYQAVCSHGNHKVANVLTKHIDELQLMYTIKSQCKWRTVFLEILSSMKILLNVLESSYTLEVNLFKN